MSNVLRIVCFYLLFPALLAGWRLGYGLNDKVQAAPPPSIAPHSDHNLEIWSFMGTLHTEQNETFAFQLDFQRLGLPNNTDSQNTSTWIATHIYRAQFSLTDTRYQRFRVAEQLARATMDLSGSPPLGLAGFDSQSLRLWVYNWSFRLLHHEAKPVFSLQASAQDSRIDLTLRTEKAAFQPPLASTASLNSAAELGYQALPRLRLEGTLQLAGQSQAVTGTAWLDHSWQQLNAQQITGLLDSRGPQQLPIGSNTGWTRFVIQLADQRELWLLRIPNRNATLPPLTFGWLIHPEGSIYRLNRRDMTITDTAHWTSPDSNRRYSVGWRIELPHEGLQLNLTPLQQSQEVRLSVHYWSGAVTINGQAKGQSLTGQGFVQQMVATD